MYIAQGIFGHDPVFALAQQDSDGGHVAALTELLVNGLDVEIELSRILRLKRGPLRIFG
jgi:hypothetical protein